MNVRLYLKDKTGEYVNIPLYGDESIRYQSKISDAEDLETVFNDSTNNFSIPATDEANKVFDYWFEMGIDTTELIPGEIDPFPPFPGGVEEPEDVEIDRGFKFKDKVDAYIELEGIPYKYGKVVLQGVEYKDKLPEYYTIEFFGTLLRLSDSFKEDKLKDLTYLKGLEYDYTSSAIVETMTGGRQNRQEDIVTPIFLNTGRDIKPGLAGDGDILTEEGAILEEELRPGVKVSEIIKAIENKYDITFNSNFFRRDIFEKLYLWLNNKEDHDDLLAWRPLKYVGLGVVATGNIPDSITYNNNNFQFIRDKRKFTNFNFPIPQERTLEWINEISVTLANVSFGNVYVKLRLRDIDTGEIVDETEDWELAHNQEVKLSSSMSFIYGGGNFRDINRYTIEYKCKNPVQVRVIVKAKSYIKVNYLTLGEFTAKQMDNVRFYEREAYRYLSKVDILNNLPDMTVADFFKGLMDMFRLVIVADEEDGEYIVNTLSDYYESGEIMDLTHAIDSKAHNARIRDTYREINFKAEESTQVLQKGFEKTYNRVYGDYQVLNEDLKGKKDIELPFNNLLLLNTKLIQEDNSEVNLNIGLMQDVSSNGEISPFIDGSFLFYYNGIHSISDTPIYVQFQDTLIPLETIASVDIIDSEELHLVKNSLIWGKEIIPSLGVATDKTLYNNFWKGWVNNLYNKNSRLVSFKGIVDFPLINRIKLNSRIIVDNNIYIINDYSINLTNNELDISLFPYLIGSLEYIPPIDGTYIFISNPASTFGTLDLREEADWKITKSDFGDGTGWLNFNIEDSDILEESTGSIEFKGRYLNFKTLLNTGNTRQMYLELKNLDTNTELQALILQTRLNR